MMMRTTRRLLAAAALALPMLGGAAQAQNWPERPITMVIPFAPGGPTDVVGRLIAEAMGRDADALIENADALHALGITMFTVGVNGPDYDLAQAEVLCRWRDRRQAGD